MGTEEHQPSDGSLGSLGSLGTLATEASTTGPIQSALVPNSVVFCNKFDL